MVQDSAGQEIQLGDLVVYKKQYRYSRMGLGRVVSIGNNTVTLVHSGYKYRDGEKVLGYKMTGAMNPQNCYIVEREFVQPSLKEKLEAWNGKKTKRGPVDKALGMGEFDVAMWSQTRCTPMEM